MNAKHLIAASVLALLGSAASAGEVTVFIDPPSKLSRAEVLSELARARAEGVPLASGESSRFAEHDAVSTRSREEVRAEARAAGRAKRIGEIYVGG